MNSEMKNTKFVVHTIILKFKMKIKIHFGNGIHTYTCSDIAKWSIQAYGKNSIENRKQSCCYQHAFNHLSNFDYFLRQKIIIAGYPLIMFMFWHEQHRCRIDASTETHTHTYTHVRTYTRNAD